MLESAILAAWAVLLLAWGGFWRADQRLPAAPPPDGWPDVAVLIPARDEAPTIARVVAAHRATDYPGRVAVIVVDDGSTDGTGDLARTAGAEVIAAPPLPAGWSGKLWALSHGVAAAARTLPGARWLLLTDADILHAPVTLARLVAWGEARGLALVSLMARLDTSGWGRLLIPAFVFFFQKLYPFAWVNRPGHWAAGAAGGCVLIRRDALDEIGGIAAIKGALIDDCTLAARVKRGPPRRAIWLGLAGDEAVSLRDNASFGANWAMVTRTAFTQLRHSAALLAGAVAGMVFLYLLPPGLVAFGLATGAPWTAAAGTGALAMMLAAYRPTARLYRTPLWAWAGLPVAAALYTAMTLASALRHWRGKGGRWKGRTYP